MGKTAYFDVTFGAAGDMILASFIDLGLSVERIDSELKKLGLPDFSIVPKRVARNSISALQLEITCPDELNHRDFKTIRAMICESELNERVKDSAIKIFTLLAEAEAKVHGRKKGDVTFHEVGALDSIIDIVGIAIALDHFDVDSAICSAIPLTSGAIDCAHGKIPAMSPASTLLLKGQRFYRSDVTGELITPTAAAVIKMLTEKSGNFEGDIFYQSIGTGAGSKEFDTHPSIMRIFLQGGGSSMQNDPDKKCGTLYLVSTPIGNLKDITFRAVEVLKSVGLIAAEDTRHTRKLLNHYSISVRSKSYHDHNKVVSGDAIIRALLAGTDVALVSDAGTPGISDPGYYLVNLAHKNGLKVTACPGPCAAVMALSISGMPTDKFSFFGFLPVKPGKRKKFIKSLANENKSVLLYESSGRIENLLKDVYDILGDRYIVLARELTKIFEETIRGRVSDLLKEHCFSKAKGEFTVIIAKDDTKEPVSPEDIKGEIISLLNNGTSVKETSKQISDKYGISKKEVYSFCLQLS